ncbi:MAG: 3'-5' exonuclease [Gemmatimonadaceae bacterium]
MADNAETLAQQLSANPDYIVVRKLHPIVTYGTTPATNIKRALLVDVETTGLSHVNDAIIELGVVLFTYNADNGQVLEVLAGESWFDDPGRAIPDAVLKLTGISDADVAGQHVNEVRLRELATDVGLIIAHNASFDRPFIDRKFPFLADRHWGCSMADVPWNAMGIGSQKLDYLLYMHTRTFLDTHHRALDDCRATLHVLATSFADGKTPLATLLTNCRAQRVRISAVRSPFETKDKLRQRGYSWSGEAGNPPKTWCKELLAQDADAEVQWLRDQVYANPSGAPVVEKVDLRKRYSAS